MDFGFKNPFVCLWMQVDGAGVVRVIDEYVREKKIIAEHAAVVKQRTPCDESQVAGTFVDPSGAGRNGVTGTSEIKVLRDKGIRATPTVVDWNNDAKKDLVVGAYDGKIHIFINEGTDTEPNFLAETFAQEDANGLVVPQLRSSPCILDVDGDGKKDILTGNTEGQLLLYLNVGTDQAPAFSGYSLVESEGAAIDLPSSSPSDDVRSRPFVCDWTGDGYLDILVGAGTAMVHLYEGLVFAGDMEPDGDVDLADFAVFSPWWLDGDCGSKDDCGGADIGGDGDVLLDDFAAMAWNWLAGK